MDNVEIPHLRLVTTGVDRSGGYKPVRTIEEVRGIATVKRNLQEIVESVHAREHKHRSTWLGGLLLYGPVGCGKVFSVEVIASELHATMHLIDMNAGWDRKSFVQAVKDTLTDAKAASVTVLHFENIDATLAESLFSAVLDDLDEGSHSGDLIITGSATLPWQVSPIVVQPGRLDRVLLVLPPDPPSRALFLHEKIRGWAEVTENDIEWMVEHTEGHSFNDLQQLIETALQYAEKPGCLDHSAIRMARRDVPPSSAQWLSTAGHHALMNEGGGLYDDLLQYFHMRSRR